jgi:hypothetical protein
MLIKNRSRDGKKEEVTPAVQHEFLAYKLSMKTIWCLFFLRFLYSLWCHICLCMHFILNDTDLSSHKCFPKGVLSYRRKPGKTSPSQSKPDRTVTKCVQVQSYCSWTTGGRRSLAITSVFPWKRFFWRMCNITRRRHSVFLSMFS